MSSQQGGLVALYVAQLPEPMQVEEYARFLQGIKEKSQREKYIQAAERMGLDTQEITKRTVQLITEMPEEHHSHSRSSALPSQLNDSDRERIRGIDFFSFDQNHWQDALLHANALSRVFLRNPNFISH